MIKLIKIFSFCAILMCTGPISTLSDFESPTRKYLKIHTMDDIKYNLRLDNASLIYKDLFDKVITKECEGFIGYHGDSLEYRIYQDVIKIILEEVVGIDIPQNFHFLDIPCFRDQNILELEEVPRFFLPEKNLSTTIEKKLFPANIALYANYNRIGFSSVSNFTSNTSTIKPECLIQDLKDFFGRLGINPSIVDEAFFIGKSLLKDDRGILLQIFDQSKVPYSFANRICYPSFPNGYPFANRTISEYFYEEDATEYPNELKLILTDHYTLNPQAPLIIQRYDKMQSSTVKNYEATLRELIQKLDYEPEKVEEYHQKLMNAWMQ